MALLFGSVNKILIKLNQEIHFLSLSNL